MQNTYAKHEVTSWPIPNYWDGVALCLVIGIIAALGWGAKAMLGHFQVGQSIAISLDPKFLPYYALRTVIRMFTALSCALVFTFIFGAWAAKSRHAERIIIPLIDIFQSVPVLGFLSITIVGFIVLFRGSLLGPECAAIFAIFTAQVWNMTLSFYQSLRTIPSELVEASQMFQLSAWQKFWKIEVPFAMPGLIWNMMLSMSGSWVFLVAAESISVANQHITLPGVGSYIALAVQQADKTAIFYVILEMLVVIALYDQLLFRPLVAWAQKFKAEEAMDEIEPESWVLNLFQRARFFQFIGAGLSSFSDYFVNRLFPRRFHRKRAHPKLWLLRLISISWYFLLMALISVILIFLGKFIFSNVAIEEGSHVLYLGFITGIRVISLIIISSIIWVPIGVSIGLHPRAAQVVQPIAQFLAAFPVNLLFPLVVMGILYFHLDVNIWVSPLMILGTQWYILFNVIAGTIALPKNLHYAVDTLSVKGWLWWRKFILPGIFPYYITGAITAAGGAWNISIIAEAVQWGNTQLWATGLGAYIAKVSSVGDFPRLALGISVMSLYVLTLNRFLWRPLYNLAQERFELK